MNLPVPATQGPSAACRQPAGSDFGSSFDKHLQRGRMKRRAANVGDMGREIADRSIRIEQAGTFAARLAIAQQFHDRLLLLQFEMAGNAQIDQPPSIA